MQRPPRLRFVQLPIPSLQYGSPTGNVPLAAGSLTVAARAHLPHADVELVAPELTDRLGDERLIELLVREQPDLVGFSLYLWNSERSLHLARELRRRAPRTRVVVGGPEISPDNHALLCGGGFDVAVLGEAEELFAPIASRLLEGGDAAGLPGAGVVRDGRLHFTGAAAANFPIDRHPSPYLAGVVPVDPTRATYVETVRGCRSHCTFCFYPRSSALLRSLSVADSARLVRELKDRGAREIVFLDPTFNHRPGFTELLDALREVNRDGALTFFAEVRAEGITPGEADQLAAAGFHRLEIGLQSVNREALTRSRRGGSAERVAAAAALFQARGIDLLIDLIVGLPGDRPADVLAGVDFLIDHGLGDHAQVFPLSILPGTAMRASAAADGVEYDPLPPYRVRRTGTMTTESIHATLLAAEDRLERRLDEQPRPMLIDPHADDDPPLVFRVRVDDSNGGELPAGPGSAHVALWLIGRDLWQQREAVTRAIRARIATDPHAILDVVLVPLEPPPLNLIDVVRDALDAAPASFARAWLRHRGGEDAMHRICVLLGAERRWSGDYLDHLLARVAVFQDTDAATALRQAERLGVDRPAARITGGIEPDDARLLMARADPDAVAFARRDLERWWVAEALGQREIASAPLPPP